MTSGKDLLSDLKFKDSYAKFLPEENRLENWDEAATDVMSMHYNKFSTRDNWKDIQPYYEEALQSYRDMRVLTSMRNLQFREKHVTKHNARLFNCSTTYVDRPQVFKEIMWVLLCGAGVGFSVETRFTECLPLILQRKNKEPIVHVIDDSIEGWAYAIDALMDSFFNGSSPLIFDYSQIREKGSLIAGEFIAPGHEGLKTSLDLITRLLNSKLENKDSYALKPIDCHDIICIMADAVLSGGVRRAALISLFDYGDEEMMLCKTGNWFVEAPWRARSNNSVKILKGSISKEEFLALKKPIIQYGEPGIILVDDIDAVYNPCCEIAFIPRDPKTGKSCWSFCNLCEIIGSKCKTEEDFYKACRSAAIIGTFQASYTDFSFLGQSTQNLVEWEALLGVSITGIMDNPSIFLEPEILKRGAEIVKEVNKELSALIGINQAARTTCVKPSGNASVLAKTSSGCHPAHSRRYFRTVQFNKETPISKFLKEYYEDMLEEGVYSNVNADYACFIPIVESENTLVKKDLSDIDFIKAVQTIQENWVIPGANKDLGYSNSITHNVSNTISVENWDAVFDYIYANQKSFSGLSFLARTGDKIYKQAPFVEVKSREELTEEYGDAAIFSSGLIVDSLHIFENDLWDACDAVTDRSFILTGDRVTILLKKDIIHRIKKFSKNYFQGDLQKTVNCLKDIHLYHKWVKIVRALEENPMDLNLVEHSRKHLNADEMAGAACSGGNCEVDF